MKAKLYTLYIVFVCVVFSCTQQPKVNIWPENTFGGNEKLFLTESDFIRMRTKIDTSNWARNIYSKLKKSVLDSVTYYTHSGPEDWTKSIVVKDAAIYYRLSGDQSVLPFIKDALIETYKLNAMHEPLLSKENSLQGFWSWGMFRMGNLEAWDLIKNNPECQDLVAPMHKRLDEIIIHGMAYYNAIKRLGNTQFWGVTTMGIAGFMRENNQAIDLAIDGKHGFKASLLRFRDSTFWPEPLKYNNGYVASAMLMLAEASRTNNREDLYAYKAENGASFKGMMDGFVSLLLTDGSIPIRGDGSEYVHVKAGKVGSKVKYFYKQEDSGYRPNIKVELLYSIFKDPVYSWMAAQNKDRDCWDNNFWGWTALTHGVSLKIQQAPSAKSVVYQEFGSALLRSDTTSNYWGSNALTAFVRNGSSIQFHSHNEQFALDVIAYKKQIYFDNFLSWDYLAPRASRNRRNATPFSNRIIAHNTVAVDFREPDKSVIKLGSKSAEIPGADFSKIVYSGPMQMLTTTGSIYNGVKETRTVGVTKEYVLDIFNCESSENHTYDYALHSFGDLSFSSDINFKAYPKLNEEFGLGKIDLKAKNNNNTWLLNAEQSLTDTSFSAVFKDTDTIGMHVLIAGEKGTKILKAEVPYYISNEGWDEVLPQNMPKRKPLLLVRRHAKNTKYVVLHVPFKDHEPHYKLKVQADKIIIENLEFIDEYFFNEKILKRTSK
ncbi:hypothetical protein [Formosa algae]|uniref:hypothetical protein n=1 Tax=Formosa algae TaxID=225843 RepID=UPI0011AFCAA3|nr:hypothetical protein [Formosa algae]